MASTVSQVWHWLTIILVVLVGHISCQHLVWTKLPEPPDNFLNEGLPEGGQIWCCFEAKNVGAPTNTPITYTLESSHFGLGGPNKNALMLREHVDREEQADIQFIVTAETKRNSGEPVKLEYKVYFDVHDFNDKVPFFTSPSVQYQRPLKDFSVSVTEDTAVGTTVFKDVVAGVDKDASATYSRLDFSCAPNGDPHTKNSANNAEAKAACETFSVTTHQLTGNGNFSARFKLLKKLNFRTKEKYVMTLTLDDFETNGTIKHRVYALMIVEVIDIQNEPPVCYRKVMKKTLNDGTTANFFVEQIQAEDQDMENPLDKNPLGFSISKVVPAATGMFKLIDFNCTDNQQYPKSFCTGMFTNMAIDREKNESTTTYTVHVLVKEFDKKTGNYLGFSTTCLVIVTIKDMNDNAPMLIPPTKTIDISEGHRDAVFTLKVEDADLPENSKFNITIIQSYDAFRLEPDNPHQKIMIGQVFPKKDPQGKYPYLDYEVPQYRKHVIKVVATEYDEADKKSPLHTSTGTYTIIVNDENDNAPKFAQTEYSANVKENSLIGTFITQITATDKDSAKFGPIKYKIEGDSKQRAKIDELTGRITVSGKINYEEEPKFNVFVVATDKLKKESTVKLLINVIDQNDVNPVFDSVLLRTKITEKQKNLEPPVTVKATDKETGRVTYSIIDGNTKDNAFQVDPNSGVMSVTRPLNYAEAPGQGGVFNIIVEAHDGGSPPGKSNATVRVQVVDVNDFAPLFKQASYVGAVDETAAPETPVVRVSAVDNDGGVNGQFRYRINAGSNDQFFIKPDGWIIVAIKAKLDYDTQKIYNMQVHAVDLGAPQKTGSCNVLINIRDKNNKKPEFNPRAYYKTLQDSAPQNTVIVTTVATDKDTTSKLSYRIPWVSFRVQDANSREIVGSPIVDQVSVDQFGRAFLRRKLQPEAATQFTFLITAEDVNAEPKGTQTATATVIVSIFKDKGDTPVFNSPWTKQNPVYTLYIPEEQGINSAVLALSAWDPKEKKWLRNFAKVPDSDPKNFFKVGESTGEVTQDTRVDYEVLNPKVIRCMVVVTTHDGRNATALIIVNVQDINDNSPKFALPAFKFSILENARYRAVVGNVRATDPDSGTFGQIQYILSGTRAHDFMIDQGNGDILSGGRLDREKYSKYELLVTAVDNPKSSQGRKSGIAAVTVQVLDVNDNAPLFERSDYHMFTMESTPPDTSLGKVLATDRDEGTNAQVFYAIAGGNAQGLFKLDQFTGTFRNSISLMGFARGLPYKVIVEAVDNGVPSRLRSIATIHVTIQDPQAFIGRPTFIYPTPGLIKEIPEEQPVGYFVLQCKASDSDGPVSALRYSFLSTRNPDHQKFNLSPLGNLTTAEVLDREKKAQYDLQLSVTDATGNLSTIMLTIRLTDIDDNPPSFFACNKDAKDPLLGKVYENEKPPKYVLTVLACDLDAFPNNLLFFKITCGNEMHHFSIGLRSGIINTKVSLDREKIAKYTLCVTVYSADPSAVGRRKRATTPIKSSRIGVIIEVLDRDDNGPTFTNIPKRTFTTGLLINAPYNSLVIDAHAYDPDTPPHSITFYRILNMQFVSGTTSRSAPGAFQVDMTTGEVRTSIASYSDYTNGYFNILIEAYDKLGRKDNATVLIYVLTQSQRLKFIFSRTPQAVRGFIPTFMSDVSYVVKSRITTDLIRFSVGDAADFDFKRTDVCFHMVKDNNIVLYNAAVELLSSENTELQKIYKTYEMTGIGLCNIGVKTYTRYTEISFWWVIIVLALFLFIFVLILVIVIVCLWNRYRKFMLTNTSYIVRMGTDGQLITNQVKNVDTVMTASALAASQMTTTQKTTKISYDEVDIGAPVVAPAVIGGGRTEEVTVLTKTSDGGYQNYGYDNRESLEMSSFRAASNEYDNTLTMGAAESSTTTTTTTENISGGVYGGTVITGAVVGGAAESTTTTTTTEKTISGGVTGGTVIVGAPATGGSTTTVTKETTNLEVPSAVSTEVMTVNAGGTPTVLRKVVTTTTTVTEEFVEEPAPEAGGVVITEVTGDAQPLAIDQRY